MYFSLPLAPPTGNKEKYGWLARLSICVLMHAQTYSIQCSDTVAHQIQHSQVLPGYPHSSAGAYALIFHEADGFPSPNNTWTVIKIIINIAAHRANPSQPCKTTERSEASLSLPVWVHITMPTGRKCKMMLPGHLEALYFQSLPKNTTVALLQRLGQAILSSLGVALCVQKAAHRCTVYKED